MVINGENVNLIRVDGEIEEFQNSIQFDDEIVNMTETKLYAPGMPTELIFKIESENKLIGELKFKSVRWFNRKAELSIFIMKEYRKKGYGFNAFKSAIDYAFKNLNFHRLEAEVIEFNKTSKKIIEKLGFVKEGTLREAKYNNGKYWDIYRYGLLRSEFKS